MRSIFFIFILSTLFVHDCRSQTEQEFDWNVRSGHNIGISMELGGGVFGGPSFDVFLIPQLDLDITVLPAFIAFGIGVGLRYHPIGGRRGLRWSPYIGIEGGYIVTPIVDVEKYASVYVPVGVQYSSINYYKSHSHLKSDLSH